MAQLVINKQYSDPEAPTAAQLDAAFDSITTFFNITGIGPDNLQLESISTALIQDGTVTETKLGLGAVTENKLMASSATLQKLSALIQQQLDQPGMMDFIGAATAPDGWLLCDGAEVSRTTYSRLYSVIGNRFGSGDGVTTFHLPDMRGRIPRGVDGTAGRDPNSATRVASNTGGNVGNSVGSVQSATFQRDRISAVTGIFNNLAPATPIYPQAYPNGTNTIWGFLFGSATGIAPNDLFGGSASESIVSYSSDNRGIQTTDKNVALHAIIKI